MAKQVDAEQLVDNLQNAKFGLSIQNIVAIVTVLSSLIAGWYTFTGRIDSLEEVVQGFADASDIELVGQKLDTFEKDIDYLKERIDSFEGVDLSGITGDIIKLEAEIKDVKRNANAAHKHIEKHEVDFHGDPLAKFKKIMTFVITEPCISTCDTACVAVCPVDCIHGPIDVSGAGAEVPGLKTVEGLQLYIDPEECIDCGACEPECPVDAIYDEDDLPEEYEKYTEINANFFEE